MAYYNYNEDEIHEGQQKVNGALSEVDRKIVEILKSLTEAVAATPGAAHRINLTNINTALKEAYLSSVRVAEIKPPGCEPQFEVDPNHWSVVLSATP